ncbi:DUF6597 domain-containing transcriptional factor [Propionibacteriaceae bacterium Y1685]
MPMQPLSYAQLVPDRKKATATGRGILDPEVHGQRVRTERFACSPALSSLIENYWRLEWSLPGSETFTAQTLPHPTCSLTVERGHTRPEVTDDPVVITGVVTRRFDVEVAGEGWVWGIKFRPGGLAAMSGVSARTWRDAVRPAATELPSGLVEALRGLDAATPTAELISRTDAALTPYVQQIDDRRHEQLLIIVAEMLTDRSLIRVDQLEERCAVSSRTLQRLFDFYVGVGPKWVLARYRMHDVVAELDSGYNGLISDLAARYGWYDQAHFVGDFTALVGVPPSRYRQRRSEEP